MHTATTPNIDTAPRSALKRLTFAVGVAIGVLAAAIANLKGGDADEK